MRPHPPARQVTPDDDVYYIVKLKQTHERLGHADSKKIYEAVRLDASGIYRDEVEWFADHRRRWEFNRPNRSKAPLQPIGSGGINKRVQTRHAVRVFRVL